MTTNVETIKEVLKNTPKGANIILEWERPVKVKKSYDGAPITKKVRMVGRTGIDYENIQAVKDKRESGELPSEGTGSWFHHDEEVKGIVYHNKTEAAYVQLFTGTSKKVKPSAEFLVNGEVVQKDEIAPFLLASELKTEKGETFICKVENMKKIHHEIPDEEISANVDISEIAEKETA